MNFRESPRWETNNYTTNSSLSKAKFTVDIITLSSYFWVICFIKARLADGFVGLECNIHMTFDPGTSVSLVLFSGCDKEDYYGVNKK